jgi:hypothetical protein
VTTVAGATVPVELEQLEGIGGVEFGVVRPLVRIEVGYPNLLSEIFDSTDVFEKFEEHLERPHLPLQGDGSDVGAPCLIVFVEVVAAEVSDGLDSDPFAPLHEQFQPVEPAIDTVVC